MNILFFTRTMISIISLNWAVFTSDTGGFSVLSPAELTHEVKQLSTANGDIAWNNYSYHTTDTLEQVFLYSITHYTLPMTELHPDSTELVDQLFEETLATISERIGGEVLYTEDEKMNNFPARLSRVKYQDGKYSVKNKMVLTNDKIFLIEVFSTYESGSDFKVKKFIDSFTLLD